jgi:hypothetical protein
VIVATEGASSETEFRRWAALIGYVERGGEAILLRPPLLRAQPMVNTLLRRFGVETLNEAQNPVLRTGLFPMRLRNRNAAGIWVPANHAARPHPIFEGLPVDGFLGQTYQNVLSAETISGLSQPPIVGVLSAEWNSGTIDRDYRGLSNVWWGSDMTVLPHGKGHFLLSTFLLLEHLGQDPVAGKLLFNMIRWSASRPGAIAEANVPLDVRFRKELEAFRALAR